MERSHLYGIAIVIWLLMGFTLFASLTASAADNFEDPERGQICLFERC